MSFDKPTQYECPSLIKVEPELYRFPNFSQMEAAQPPTATAQPEPYLVPKQSRVGVGGSIRSVVLTKCKCSSTWCKDCFKARGAKTIAKKLMEMDSRRVRHLMLSVDRSKYVDGQTAYLAIVKGGLIRGMCRNLKRMLGKTIERWLWVLEWHVDGFPHWHLFIEMAEAGKAGMIGYEQIDRYWGQGIVHENYIHNRDHWKNLTGYFSQAGYFELTKKDHQGKLPAWAMESGIKIHRFGASRGKFADSVVGAKKGAIKEDTSLNVQELEAVKVRRSYAVILAGCGKETRIRLYDEQGNLRNCWMAAVPVQSALIALRDIPRVVNDRGKFQNICGPGFIFGLNGLHVTRASAGFEYCEGTGYLLHCDSEGFSEVIAYFRDNGLRKAHSGEQLMYGAACN